MLFNNAKNIALWCFFTFFTAMCAMNIFLSQSGIHTWTRQQTGQDEPNKFLICALWKVDSSFTEVSNEAALKQMSKAFSSSTDLRQIALFLPRPV